MFAQSLCVWTALVWVTLSEAPPAADGLQWEANLETAQRAARGTNRLVLIHFGGPWCEPCQVLEKQVFSRPGFGRELRSRFVAVKVDPREHPDLGAKYGVKAVPSDVVTTASGQMIYRVPSPANAAAYVETMNRIADTVLPVAETALASANVLPAAEAKPPQNAVQQNAVQQNAPPPVGDATDRYADYYRSRRPTVDQPANGPAPAVQQMPRDPALATAVSMRAQAGGNSAAVDHRQLAQPQVQPKVITPKAPGNPPVALDGYCAVTLVQKRAWLAGDKRWGAIHRGRTYLFASEESQKTFLADPDRYSPVLAGNDPVLRLDDNQDVPGKREHGAFYNDRIYLFANEETFLRFDRDPARYTIDNRQALRR